MLQFQHMLARKTGTAARAVVTLAKGIRCGHPHHSRNHESKAWFRGGSLQARTSGPGFAGSVSGWEGARGGGARGIFEGKPQGDGYQHFKRGFDQAANAPSYMGA